MGGHKVPKMEIPDHKIYQVGEHTPDLQEVVRKLKLKGLKDPWIRNEVWRFDIRDMGTPQNNMFNVLKRGFWPGLALALVTTAITKYFESQDAHNHGSDGHH